MKLWENRDKLGTVDFPQNYIYTMARNRTFDLLAKIGRDKKLIEHIWANISQSDELTKEILDAKESQQLINEAVAGLSKTKQQIFELSRQKGLSHDEIAALLGLSKQTIKNQLSESLKQIKHYLEQHSNLLAIIFWLHHFKNLF